MPRESRIKPRMAAISSFLPDESRAESPRENAEFCRTPFNSRQKRNALRDHCWPLGPESSVRFCQEILATAMESPRRCVILQNEEMFLNPAVRGEYRFEIHFA